MQGGGSGGSSQRGQNYGGGGSSSSLVGQSSVGSGRKAGGRSGGGRQRNRAGRRNSQDGSGSSQPSAPSSKTILARPASSSLKEVVVSGQASPRPISKSTGQQEPIQGDRGRLNQRPASGESGKATRPSYLQQSQPQQRRILASRPTSQISGASSGSAITDEFKKGNKSKEPSHANVARPLTAKLLNNKFEFCIYKAKEFLKGFSRHRVIGVLGGQGVGKSTILGMLGQRRTEDNTFMGYMNAGLSSGKSVGPSGNQRPNRQRFQDVIFPAQTEDCFLSASFQTSGIDMHVSDEGVIFLDTQPVLSPAVLEQVLSKEHEANFPNFIISPVHYVEYTSLLMVLFLFSVCHVVVVVQDWVADHALLKLLKTAEMILPFSFNSGQIANSTNGAIVGESKKGAAPLGNYSLNFPHTVFVYNRIPPELFTMDTLQNICLAHQTFFRNSRILSDVAVVNMQGFPGPLSCKEDAKVELMSFEGQNVFMLPTYCSHSACTDISSWSDDDKGLTREEIPLCKDFDVLFSDFKTQILSAVTFSSRDSIDQDWIGYASQLWESLKKSNFVNEYNRILKKMNTHGTQTSGKR
eukprot:Nk52_evm35s1737 gene=Nk52_evmTU35s1737